MGYSNSPSDYANSYAWLFGYSSPSNPAGRVYFFPSFVNRQGSPGSVYQHSPSVMVHNMDTLGGDSGACVLQNMWWYIGDYSYYCVSMHYGGAGPTAPGLNYGRRVDALYVTYLQTWTSEW